MNFIEGNGASALKYLSLGDNLFACEKKEDVMVRLHRHLPELQIKWSLDVV